MTLQSRPSEVCGKLPLALVLGSYIRGIHQVTMIYILLLIQPESKSSTLVKFQAVQILQLQHIHAACVYEAKQTECKHIIYYP